MIEHSLQIAYTEFDSVEELNPQDKLLIQKAMESCSTAYAPYSRFYVGASVRLANGMIISGNNQENAAYPSGLCAERVALFAASSQHGQHPVESIAVAVDTEIDGMQHPVTPCGSCRQVMAEYENLAGVPMNIWMVGKNGKVWLVKGVSNLLPLMFQGDKLKK